MTSDYVHRDRVMRSWFDGRTWDSNAEFKLKRDLIREGLPELAPFPMLIDDEWEVLPGATNGGRGDLLFTDGAGAFAVVEVKWLPSLFGGRTARTSRNKKRGAVRSQAWTYGRDVLRNYSDAQTVTVFVFTNDPFRPGLVRIGLLTRDPEDEDPRGLHDLVFEGDGGGEGAHRPSPCDQPSTP